MKIDMSQRMVSNTREDREKRSCNHCIRGQKKDSASNSSSLCLMLFKYLSGGVGSLGPGGLLAAIWTDASGTAPAYPGHEPFPWDRSHKKRSGKLDPCLTSKWLKGWRGEIQKGGRTGGLDQEGGCIPPSGRVRMPVHGFCYGVGTSAGWAGGEVQENSVRSRLWLSDCV